MRIAALGIGLVLCSCVRPTPCPTAPASSAAPAGSAGPAPAEPQRPEQQERAKIAVLPFEDEQLFRVERRALRERLAAELARRVADYEVVPLAEVDAALRPIAKSGARCAYDGVPNHRRVSGKGWLTTELVHVSGFKEQKDELWVQINDWKAPVLTLAAPWDPKLARVQRYDAAFASLRVLPDYAAGLGGLGGRFVAQGEVKVGTLTLCQRSGFTNCAPGTQAFADRAAEMAACFAGADVASQRVIFEGASRCELEGLDDTTGPDGKREACLCAALGKSAGASASKGRSRLVISHEATDLTGKPRPELRVVDATTNLHSDADWYSSERKAAVPVYRLSVDNVDAPSPALARCALPAGSVVVAKVVVGDDGSVREARVLSGTKSKKDADCVGKALEGGAYACTGDGKPAALRLALVWPE